MGCEIPTIVDIAYRRHSLQHPEPCFHSSTRSLASTQSYLTKMSSLYRIKVRVKEGRDLVAKDRDLLGRKTTSDPYVELYFGSRRIGKTPVIEKSLNPAWEDATFDWVVGFGTLDRKRSVELRIWDRDILTADDPMGNVFIPFPDAPCRVEKWYPVNCGVGSYRCPNATGKMLVAVSITPARISEIDGQTCMSSGFYAAPSESSGFHASDEILKS